MEAKALVLLLIFLAFLAFAAVNLARLKSFFLATLIMTTPIYGTNFMPREVLGIVGLNFWNIVWIITLLAIAPDFLSKRKTLRPPPFFGFALIVFIVAQLVAVAAALTDLDSFPKFGTASMGLATVILVGFIKPLQFLLVGWMTFAYCALTRDTRTIERAIFASAIAMGGLVIYYFLRGFDGSDINTGRFYISAELGMHVNALGAWAAMTLMCSLVFPAEGGFWKFVRWGAIVMATIAILLSFSRTAFIAAPIGILLVFGRIPAKERIAVIFMVAAVIIVTLPLFLQRVSTGLESGNLNEISAGRTETIWGPLLQDFKDNPVLGSGRFAQLRSKSFPRLRLMDAHSAYLQIMIDMGTVGLAITFFWLFEMYKIGRKAENMLPPLIIIMCLEGISGYSFYPEASNFVIWVIYGMALALIAAKRESTVIQSAGSGRTASALAPGRYPTYLRTRTPKSR